MRRRHQAQQDLGGPKDPYPPSEEADKAIDNLIKDGIIEKVDEPSEWISPAMFVPKSDTKAVRLVTDFTNLNRFIERPIHPFSTPAEITQSIPADAKWFAKLDAVKGYFQIELDMESRALTTFLTPRGRFRFTRAPMGLASSSDEYCQRTDQVLEGIEGIQKIVDDILIYGSSYEQLLERLEQVLTRCRQHSITLSKKKAEVDQKVKFAGYIVSQQGVEPDPEKTEGVRDFPRPENVTKLRGFLGLANQLGQFILDLAHVTQLFRQLLRGDVEYVWLDEHEQAFKASKDALTSKVIMKHFNPRKRTELLTDASRLKGIALIQRDEEDKISLIRCGSRGLTPTEFRYATIELECLGIVWAIHKCKFYLQGMDNFHVITDHRPLIGIIKKKQLDEVHNPRLQRLLEKVSWYNFEITWTPGKTHMIADALSRAPVFSPAENDIEETIITAVTTNQDPKILELDELAKADDEYQTILKMVQDGNSPDKLSDTHPAKLYASVWHEISIMDNLMTLGDRIIVPKAARKQILEILHSAHTG